MKIGILQADSVRPEFREEFGNYPGMIQMLLEASRDEKEDLTFTTYDVVQGEYPDELTACDGYVITGSASSVYDDEPWIHQLRKFVVRLHKTRTKTVGICFGHQMIALALEGVAGAADQGWEVGIHESTVVAAKPFMSPALDKVSLLYSHRDQVSKLPSGAELLAGHDFCPVSMYVIDSHMFAFQGHPEFVKGYSEKLMNFRRQMLGEETYSAGIDSLQQALDSRTIGRWMLNFLAN